MTRIAVLPGSFDPVTRGHMDLAVRCVKLFGSCEVVVMNNDAKTYLFSLEERYRLCREAFSDIAGVKVFVYDGMLYEFLKSRPKAVLVKGLRDEKDYLYERKMARFNFEHAGVETLYLDADPRFVHLSSTKIREKMQKREDLSDLLPEKIIKLLSNKL